MRYCVPALPRGNSHIPRAVATAEHKEMDWTGLDWTGLVDLQCESLRKLNVAEFPFVHGYQRLGRFL
jgi:hypothetical protein